MVDSFAFWIPYAGIVAAFVLVDVLFRIPPKS